MLPAQSLWTVQLVRTELRVGLLGCTIATVLVLCGPSAWDRDAQGAPFPSPFISVLGAQRACSWSTSRGFAKRIYIFLYEVSRCGGEPTTGVRD